MILRLWHTCVIVFGWARDRGAFHYTLDWDNTPLRRENYWWPVAEGVAAAHVLGALLEDDLHEDWYRRCWHTLDARLMV